MQQTRTPPNLSMEITHQLFEEMESNEKRLELLKTTDPEEYARVMEPQMKLRRFLHQAREKIPKEK